MPDNPTAKERRVARHSFEHNMKCFAEKCVDEVIKTGDFPNISFRTFYCSGEDGEQGALLEKWNQWIQGYARYTRWLGITTLEDGGNKLQLIWKQEPEFLKADGSLTLNALVAIVVEDED